MIISMKQVIQIQKAKEGGESIADLAVKYGISEQQVEGYIPIKKKRKSRAKSEAVESEVAEQVESA